MNGGDMSRYKDPAIKLFGAKIPVPTTQIPAKSTLKGLNNCKEIITLESVDDRELDKPSDLGGSKELKSLVQGNKIFLNGKPNEDHIEANGIDQDKVFKKPDKILPCPRCNSLETKFCYFNNYNVNQPRHFCKNCQRYWTAGGTMRNVPIGAGRRKNKHSAFQYHQILVTSDGVPITRIEAADSLNHQLLLPSETAATFKPSTGNGLVLKFGPDAALCESVKTVLSLGDLRGVEMGSVSCGGSGEEPSSCGSSMTVMSTVGNGLLENIMQKDQVGLPVVCNNVDMPNPPQCYPVPPLVFPWGPGPNNAAPVAATPSAEHAGLTDSSNPNPVQWSPTPMLAVPGFCPPDIPLQFMPTSYRCPTPIWPAGTGNMPVSGSISCLSPSSSTSTGCCSGDRSPTLGKHLRDASIFDEDKAGKCVLVPKMLRIDDTDGSLRSPIWTTLGTEPNQDDSSSKSVISKTSGNGSQEGHTSEATNILEANPAALSRSHTFQESS